MLSTLIRPALLAGLMALSLPVGAQAPAPAAPAAPAPAAAPSAGHLAAARELMQVTRVLGPLDELMPTFGDQIRRQNVTRPEVSKDLDEVLKALQPELELQRQRVTNLVAQTYAKWLTEAELKQVIAFFKTPIGAKFNQVQPDMVEEVVGVVGTWTNEASEYVMIRTRAELAKRGHQLQ